MPIRTAAIGPLNGIPEIISAVLAAGNVQDVRIIHAVTRHDIAHDLNFVTKSFGNKGRIGRSVRRLVNTSRVVGRPSRLRYPPANFPAARQTFAIIDLSAGRNPSLGDRTGLSCDKHTGVAVLESSRHRWHCFASSPVVNEYFRTCKINLNSNFLHNNFLTRTSR